MSGKFSYFRHDVSARLDDKLAEFSRLLGRKGKEAYFYYFTLIEYCANESDDGQIEFRIHNETLRGLWESNAKGVQSLCKLLTSSALVVCKPCANHVVFHLPNLPKYLGSYDAKKRKEKERKTKESKLIKASPLSFLFDARPDIQEWLNAGNHDTHLILAKGHSHHELAELIPKAFEWAQQKDQRAENWLITFTNNIPARGFGANRAQKSKSRITPGNPTGNPYLDDNGNLRSEGA